MSAEKSFNSPKKSPQDISRRPRKKQKGEDDEAMEQAFSEALVLRSNALANRGQTGLNAWDGLANFAHDILLRDEAEIGYGRLTVGKSKKGPDGKIALGLSARRIYELMRFLELAIASPGPCPTIRLLVLIYEDLRRAIADAQKLERRAELLRRHGIKPTPAVMEVER